MRMVTISLPLELVVTIWSLWRHQSPWCHSWHRGGVFLTSLQCITYTTLVKTLLTFMALYEHLKLDVVAACEIIRRTNAQNQIQNFWTMNVGSWAMLYDIRNCPHHSDDWNIRWHWNLEPPAFLSVTELFEFSAVNDVSSAGLAQSTEAPAKVRNGDNTIRQIRFIHTTYCEQAQRSPCMYLIHCQQLDAWRYDNGHWSLVIDQQIVLISPWPADSALCFKNHFFWLEVTNAMVHGPLS